MVRYWKDFIISYSRKQHNFPIIFPLPFSHLNLCDKLKLPFYEHVQACNDVLVSNKHCADLTLVGTC